MKKLFLLSLIALSLGVEANAQSTAKDSIAASKEAAKAMKVQKAADLKAFKEKQKADLAAFIEAQKNGNSASEVSLEKPVLNTPDDSIAYIFGVAQSNGLKQYVLSQLGVEEGNLQEFAQGVIARTNTDPNDKALAAFNAGSQLGGQVIDMVNNFSKEWFSADPGNTLDVKIVTNGLLSGLLGTSDIETDKAGETFQETLTKRQEANKEKLYGPYREACQKFLEENKTKEGVVTLPSGLQYKIITKGTGAIPTSTDKVEVDYEGKLIDGTVFDSSYKRGKSTTFGVTQVIKGWTEALQLMPVGSKWELYIPYDLAYGEHEAGKEIKPYSALIFTVELKNIIEPEPKETAAPADKKKK